MHKNQRGNFVGQKKKKTAKRTRFQAKTAEVGCVLGAGEGCSGWRRMRADGKGRSEQGRGGRLLLSLAKMEGRTCLACWLGQLAAERHWRSLAPRHAVLEWMWESAPGSGRGPVSPGSCRKPERGRCWFGAASYFWGAIVQATTTSSFERKAPPPGGWPS